MPNPEEQNSVAPNLPDNVWQTAGSEDEIEPAGINADGLTPETFDDLVEGFKAAATQPAAT